MQGSLSWIEWLDRLDRVLNGARQDVGRLTRVSSPQALAAVERCKRQLSALTDELRTLDHSVLGAAPGHAHSDRAEELQKALDTTVCQLATVAGQPQGSSCAPPERLLGNVDSALRDSCRAAAMLLGPSEWHA